MNTYNFHYAQSLLSTLYGLDVKDEDFEEIALIGWGLIGNKRTRIYRYKTHVSNCEEGIQLPCNCELLEAVTTDFEEWNYSTNDTPNGQTYSAFVESYIEGKKSFRDPLYAKGKFIKYERVGDMLYFDRPHGKINILYRGIILDNDGLPELTEKEATALATYTAYILKYREGLQTNNTGIINLAQNLYSKWSIQCRQARADYYMSQNELDQILDAKSDWNRKQFGRSLKIYH